VTRLAVIYYSASGTIERLADAVGEGGKRKNAEVRIRQVPEYDCGCPTHDAAARDRATLEDLTWADGIVFGTPACFGNVAAPLKRFLDGALPLWRSAALADKVVSAFTSAASLHGGHESTLLALYNTVYHWGGLVVSAGYTDPAFRPAGGNPYGLSASAHQDGSVTDAEIEAARALGARVAGFARQLAHAPVGR
jgi:NAD(P)H dehydrogenase (quinone)